VCIEEEKVKEKVKEPEPVDEAWKEDSTTLKRLIATQERPF
jgi:hypothetical protein